MARMIIVGVVVGAAYLAALAADGAKAATIARRLVVTSMRTELPTCPRRSAPHWCGAPSALLALYEAVEVQAVRGRDPALEAWTTSSSSPRTVGG